MRTSSSSLNFFPVSDLNWTWEEKERDGEKLGINRKEWKKGVSQQI
jgi:hypothetical protein